MPGRVIWHDRAEEDIAEAYLFIGADSPASAERLLDAVQSAVQLLLENHGAGRLREFRSPRARGAFGSGPDPARRTLPVTPPDASLGVVG